MTSETTFGREPVEIVELEQPRCALRFGTSPCTASTDDGPRCYNTWTTCLDRANYDGSGNIKWRFVRADAGGWIFDYPPVSTALTTEDDVDLTTEGDVVLLTERPASGSSNAIATDGLPCLESVSTSPTRVNVGAIRDGESPFGVRSSINIALRDFPFSDFVGDFYVSQRSGVSGAFFAKWMARNKYLTGMVVRYYQGYRGQELSAMQCRQYIVDHVSGPDARGRFSIRGADPLRLAESKRSKFPRTTQLELTAHVGAGVTTGIVIAASNVADLSDSFSNGLAAQYLAISDEILSYTGYTETSPGSGEYELTGVTRGVLNTTAKAHQSGDAAQRVGRFSAHNCWDVVYDLLIEHANVPASYIDLAAWDAEGDLYLSLFTVTATIPRPVSVEQLCGELMQQCGFILWWDEREQKIKIKAVRPEAASARITDQENIIAGSQDLRRADDERLTRVLVYYLPESPFANGDDPRNYTRLSGRISADVEGEDAGGDVREKVIYSRWLTTENQVLDLSQKLLRRTEDAPEYLAVTVDAKDRSISVGDVLTVSTHVLLTTEGGLREESWQVIAADEVEPGDKISYLLQRFVFSGQRLAAWMADDAPDYNDATEEERENGFWWCDDDGLMPDGTQGYLWQ